jgi:hypothetical protein
MLLTMSMMVLASCGCCCVCRVRAQYPLYSASIALCGGSQAGYFLDESKNWGLDVCAAMLLLLLLSLLLMAVVVVIIFVVWAVDVVAPVPCTVPHPCDARAYRRCRLVI